MNIFYKTSSKSVSFPAEYVCLCVVLVYALCAHVGVCRYVCVCMYGGWRSVMNVFHNHSVFFKIVSQLNLKLIRLASLAGQQASETCGSHFQGYRRTPPCPASVRELGPKLSSSCLYSGRFTDRTFNLGNFCVVFVSSTLLHKGSLGGRGSTHL